MEKEDGVWRTIRGRRIFIGKGEDLATAMKNSGKFSNQMSRVKKNKEKYDIIQKAKNFDKDLKKTNRERYDIDKSHEKDKWEEQEKYKARHNTKEAQRYEKNEYKKVQDFKAKKQSNNKIQNNNDEFDMRKYTIELQHDKGTKKIDTIASSKESAIKSVLKSENAPDNAVKSVKDNGSILNKQSNNKIDYDKRINDIAKLNNLDKEKEEIDKLSKETGTDKSVIRNAVDEKIYDKHLGEEYDKRYGKQSNNKVETEYPRAVNATKWEDLGLEVEDRKGFSDYLQNKYGTDDFKIINFERKDEAKQIYEDFKNKDNGTFIQNTNMYGGTREYSKEDLDRMAEQGIRPMKDSYTGGGWKGINADKHLTTSEQAKAITGEMKKQFPDVKIARRSDVYSGGSSIDFNIMSSDKDLYKTETDLSKMSDDDVFDTIRDSIGGNSKFDDWLNENKRKSEKGTYTTQDARDYLKEKLTEYKNRSGDRVDGNEWYLSDYGKEVVSALNKEANSYTYDDSDGMVDYFNHGTYMHVSIGKWNKPYQVNESKKIKDYVAKKKSNH